MSPITPIVYHVTAPDAARPLRQGEILTGVKQYKVNVSSLGTAAIDFTWVMHPYAVVLTQDCDLEQDHCVRFPYRDRADKLIPSIMFCEVATAEELFVNVKTLGSKAWDRIRQNNDIRYHYLQMVDPGCDRLNEGLPELAVDFKKYFTIPTDELYRRIELGEAQRRCVLNSPYLEHLSARFAYFLCRVALPVVHVSQ